MGEAKICRIQIDFPEPVELPHQALFSIDRGVTEICRLYEAANPDRVMWPFGHGVLALKNWFSVDEDNPQQFDESVFQIEVACREAHPAERDAREKLRHLETRGPLFDQAASLLWFARSLLEAVEAGRLRLTPADLTHQEKLDSLLARGKFCVDRAQGKA